MDLLVAPADCRNRDLPVNAPTTFDRFDRYIPGVGIHFGLRIASCRCCYSRSFRR